MRQLILLKGSPGCGKTTWINQNNLNAYTICPDDIRLMIQTPIQTLDGNFQISQKNDNDVWKLLFQILEKRMSRGELTIIDATHSRTSLISRYKHLVDQYRYRTFVVDFTDVPIEETKIRNKLRPEFKQVPENVIDTCYSRFETQKTPSWCKVIKPDNFKSEMVWIKHNYNNYKKIIHIGDIHGCYEPLSKYFHDNPMRVDYLYIFLGDYIDRGIQNSEVLNFITCIYELPNVVLLEGNHEKWLWRWACGKTEDIRSKEFLNKTIHQLDGNIDKDIIRKFYRKLQQILYYEYSVGDKTFNILVNHAGISNIPDNLIYMSLDSFINGIGTYGDDIDQHWLENTKNQENLYQIRGHRNIYDNPTQTNERSFCLEGKIEFGGHLRIVELDEEGFKVIEILNDVFDISLKSKDEKDKVLSGKSEIDQTNVLQVLRNNNLIKEKDLGNSISSFNFTREAFRSHEWNSITTKARGLFIDTTDGNIIARSYDKFFNHRETIETKSKYLIKSLVFPVVSYIKENGFLGMISYNYKIDDFFIASKTTNGGPYVEYFKSIFYKQSLDFDRLKSFLKENNVTLVFEVIDPENDPHIINYSTKQIYLLDVIANTYMFSKYPYGKLYDFAMEYNFTPKMIYKEFVKWDDIYQLLHRFDEDYDFKWNGVAIEGLVFEDSTNFMFKKKCIYYSFWKHMRSVKDSYGKGREIKLSDLHDAKSNYFYGFLKSLDREYVSAHSLIELREEYENKEKGKRYGI